MQKLLSGKPVQPDDSATGRPKLRWPPATRRWPCSATRLAARPIPATAPCNTATSAPCCQPVAASDALTQVDKQLALYPVDRRLWRLAAQTHAQLGHRLLSHRAQAEAAALSGNLIAAIEQISLGIKAGDGSFHEMSAAEARRREWQAIEKAQRKN